ncbi:YfcE family phosphodiesterase [Pelosinus sp. sgz500959]|uniref:YfcE family phosphodiesterase n=1 Tax=Pelosinus sp. sgz500959 TaxID=3242472 RepID=UPI00366F7748
MRIGVISDTHGDLVTIRQIIDQVKDVDMWMHAGDCSQDADYLRSLVKVPVYAARGNCDGHTTAKIDEFIEVDKLKIWLTHGHRYGVKQGTRELVRWAKHHAVDIVIYGHTHIVDNRWCEDVLLFNPGSSYGNRAACGVLEIHDNQVTAQMIKCV